MLDDADIDERGDYDRHPFRQGSVSSAGGDSSIQPLQRPDPDDRRHDKARHVVVARGGDGWERHKGHTWYCEGGGDMGTSSTCIPNVDVGSKEPRVPLVGGQETGHVHAPRCCKMDDSECLSLRHLHSHSPNCSSIWLKKLWCCPMLPGSWNLYSAEVGRGGGHPWSFSSGSLEPLFAMHDRSCLWPFPDQCMTNARSLGFAAPNRCQWETLCGD